MIHSASIAIAILLLSQSALALDKNVKALMSGMDCVAYHLTETQQRGELPGKVPVWSIINEGPTSVIIWASNGDKAGDVEVSDSSQPVLLFFGDERYHYTVALSRKGSALVHVCVDK